VKYSGEGNCNLKIADENKYFLSGKVLEEGWNQIGSQYYSSTSWDSVKGDCNVLKGPYYYDTVGKSWETPRTIEPGRSYFVKVSGKCTLGSELPPLPE
jgi:glucan-binding YG repeat protein